MIFLRFVICWCCRCRCSRGLPLSKSLQLQEACSFQEASGILIKVQTWDWIILLFAFQLQPSEIQLQWFKFICWLASDSAVRKSKAKQHNSWRLLFIQNQNHFSSMVCACHWSIFTSKWINICPKRSLRPQTLIHIIHISSFSSTKCKLKSCWT